jgi:ABC-type amino acid transport substrate-binding protein
MKILKIILPIIVLSITIATWYWFQSPQDTPVTNQLVVGTSLDYPPYEFTDTQTGKAAGFDIDIVTELCKRMNKTLVIKNMPFTSLIFSLLAKDCDVLAACMTPTEMRADMVTFSEQYAKPSAQVIFTKANHFTPQNVQDLYGKTVAVGTGYVSDMQLSKHPEIKLVRYDAPSDCFLALQTETVDAFVTSQSSVNSFLKHTKNPDQFATVLVQQNAEGAALGLNKNNFELLAQINKTLQTMHDDGTIEALHQKWNL